MKPVIRFRFHELIEKARDAGLSDAERTELDGLATAHPGLLESLAESLAIDAELRHDSRLIRDLPVAPSALPSRKPLALMLFAAAACAMLAALLFQYTRKPAGPVPIATLVKSTGCKWASSTLPTAEGSRVSAGTYELVEGLATLKFDSGAEVVLEAPAALELVDAMNCRLLRGTLVTDVPPSAVGFVVDTLKARVVDYGTRFGVSASADGDYMVQVLEGKVEVEDHTETALHKLGAGQNLDRGLLKQKLNPQAAPAEPNRWRPDRIVNDGDGWQLLSTGYGRGKDAYVESSATSRNYGQEAYFRVKRSSIQIHLNRLGFLAFDLGAFEGRGFENAELNLAIEPSDLGFATLVPDSRFAVYGLTDESADDWSETEIKGSNAPAYAAEGPDPHLPAADKTVLLGRFAIAQGVSRGSCTLTGQPLIDFLNADTNGLVTLIICRDTDETAKGGLVHAFATKENGSNTPPLLRLKPKP